MHRNISYEMVFDKIERVFLSSFEHSYMPHTKEFIIMEENKFRSYHTHTHTHKKKLDYFSYLDVVMTQSLHFEPLMSFWRYDPIRKYGPIFDILNLQCHFEEASFVFQSRDGNGVANIVAKECLSFLNYMLLSCIYSVKLGYNTNTTGQLFVIFY